MYNLTNSPSGPLGGAGQSNNSTMPHGLFANASPAFNNFGKGIESFTNNVGDKAKGVFKSLFGNLFGGNGDMSNGIPNPSADNNGVPSLFGAPSQPGAQGMPTVQGPMAPPPGMPGQVPNAMQTAMGPNGAPAVPGQAGASGAGILSRFMGGAQQ